MEIRVKKYDHVSGTLPRIHNPRDVVKLREEQARRAKTEKEREEYLQSADEWRRAKPVWNKVDRYGKPVFTSKRDIEEFQARTGRQFKFD